MRSNKDRKIKSVLGTGNSLWEMGHSWQLLQYGVFEDVPSFAAISPLHLMPFCCWQHINKIIFFVLKGRPILT